jgi:tetraacyldisaccharide 4'-kinase
MSVLEGIYGAVIGARNSMYESGGLRTERLQGPVVSVGNISVGGAGKTPFTILLGGLLKQRGVEFDVISRGYGRGTSGVLEVNPDGSAQDYGDEPLLIARSLAVTVVVGEKRIEAGRYAEQKYGPRLHLLDDAFQHRQLARDFDIVMLSRGDLRDRLLPGGKLREPTSSLARADVLVSTDEVDGSMFHDFGKPVWSVRRSLILPEMVPAKVIAFCGIARPEKFFADLHAAGVSPMKQLAFRDHHRYRAADIRGLITEQQRTGAAGFITTAKDEINLGTLASQLHGVCVARVGMELEKSGEALDFLVHTLETRKRVCRQQDSATGRCS